MWSTLMFGLIWRLLYSISFKFFLIIVELLLWLLLISCTDWVYSSDESPTLFGRNGDVGRLTREASVGGMKLKLFAVNIGKDWWCANDLKYLALIIETSRCYSSLVIVNEFNWRCQDESYEGWLVLWLNAHVVFIFVTILWIIKCF